MFRACDPPDVVVGIKGKARVAGGRGEKLCRQRIIKYDGSNNEDILTRKPSSLMKIVDVPPCRA